MLGYKKGETQQLCGQMPAHYPADMVYLDGDKTKTVQDAIKIVNYSDDSEVTIPAGGTALIVIQNVIPSGYAVYGAHIVRSVATTSNGIVIGCPLLDRDNNWKLILYNSYNSNLTIVPNINLLCIKNGYYTD